MLEKIEQNKDILLVNDRFIELIIKSIPKLFENFHVSKIRKHILKIIYKLLVLNKNTEQTFELIKKVHFHNFEDLLYSYIITQLNINNDKSSLANYILTHLKSNLTKSIEFTLILSLINYLNNEANSNAEKKVIIAIFSEIKSTFKIKFSNLNLLFNYVKSHVEKEYTSKALVSLIKIIVDNSKEIIFDKVYLK